MLIMPGILGFHTGAEVTYAVTSSKDIAAAPTEQPENLPAPVSFASSEPSENKSAPPWDNSSSSVRARRMLQAVLSVVY